MRGPKLYFQDILENIRLAAVIIDGYGRIVFINEFLLQTTGWHRSEVMGQSWFDLFIPAQTRSTVQSTFQGMLVGEVGATVHHIETVRTREGLLRYISWNSIVIIDQNGLPNLTCIGEDITMRNHAEEALRESEERYRTLFEKTANPILVIDEHGTYIDCNQAACAFMECSKEELLKRHVVDTAPRGGERTLAEHQLHWQTGGTIETYYEVNGNIKVLELTITPALWLGQKVIFGMGKDITERKQVEEKMRYLAYYDPLTDVPNRVLFKERVQKAINKAQAIQQKIAVMFMDLDRFKKVNDTFGHEMGDRLLQLVAERLKNGQFQATIARLGGDEFTLLFEQVQPGQVDSLAEKVLALFQAPLRLRGQAIYITPSIGIAMFPEHGRDPESLLKHADAAMYHAKALGCNRYQLYTSAFGNFNNFTIEMENSLHKALKHGEIEVYYQHQLDVVNKRVLGAEALIRWHHPQKGLVLPGDFIPIAEESGLILSIGEFVLYTSCANAVKWHQLGYPLKVAVNLSVRQFFQKNLIDMIKKVLAETKLDPSYLELEITETTAVQDMNYAKEMLNQLKTLGVGIAIDDFGVGYNSMSNFKMFPPIDTLKIDRTFVKDISNNSDHVSRALVANMIHLGKSLQIKVVAEGVETEAQLEFLQQNECDLYQGYYFSRPMTAQNFTDSLLKTR